MDESNVDLNTSRKILAIKGTEYYEEVNKTEHITLITTITADGTMMKSVLIFQGQSVPVRVKSDESILLTASPSGWVDSSSKREWFNYFCTYVKLKRNKPNEPHLLLLDGHISNWDN